MTNSPETTSAARILDELLRAMNPVQVRCDIDEPLDKAFSSFKCPKSTVQSQGEFLKVLGEFMVHLQKEALPLRQDSSLSRARAEALQLLEQRYVGKHAHGYAAALDEARSSHGGGVSTVLGSLTAIVKEAERGKYLRTVWLTRVDPLDWRIQTELVKLAQDRYRLVLPPEILECPPSQLADSCFVLMGLVLQMENFFQAARIVRVNNPPRISSADRERWLPM